MMCAAIVQIEWNFAQPATLELTHNWGTESDPNFKTHNGNEEPKGYGKYTFLLVRLVRLIVKSCSLETFFVAK